MSVGRRTRERRFAFSVLGPLEVRVDDKPIPIGGPQQRVLLAVLLCNANRAVSRDELINELGNDRHSRPDRALRVQVSRLRKALDIGRQDARLVVRAPGYLMRVGPDELDLDVFTRLVAEGRRLLDEGDHVGAANVLREAEGQWRGEPLADLVDSSFAETEATRLRQLRLAAVEDRIEAELALGWHSRVCVELEQLVADSPLRERLREQLMLALYRSGRQTDALATYRAGRTLLRSELAVEPDPRLQRLERMILLQDAALDLPEKPPGAPALAAPPPAPPAERALPLLPSHSPGRGRRRAIATCGVTLVVLATALTAAKLLPGSAPPARAATGDVLARIDPRDARTIDTVALRSHPTDLATAFGSVWVAEPASGVVARFDATHDELDAEIAVGTHPTTLAVGAGRLWVLDRSDRTLSAIDPRTDSVAKTLALAVAPADAAFGHGSVWVVDRAGRLEQVTSGSGKVVKRPQVDDITGVTATHGRLWTISVPSGAIEAIDPASGRAGRTVQVGDGPTVVADDGTHLWVLDSLDATLARVDVRRGIVTTTLPLGGAPVDLTLSDGSIWVADATGAIIDVDSQGQHLVRRVPVEGEPSEIAAYGGSIWATLDPSQDVHRGGTLTTDTAEGVIDTIDPAASTSINLTPPRLFGLTNDGLVSLDHVAGSSGYRLVPDLAMSLPTPTDGGRVYTFRLRPGIRYSTGVALEPSDVTHSIERLFAIGSSGAPYFSAVVGARECERAPATCDLSRGVVADDAANTVTFRLSRPDPDLLYKLTLTYGDVLPATAADREAHSPLPATGPYMTVSYSPGREIRMTRNPYFRVWSAVAQPDGYPDRIVLRLDRSGPEVTHAVRRGAGDFAAFLGKLLPPTAHFVTSHPDQAKVHPSMSTGALALNVTAPPFDDVRVRRAVNLALDRNQVAAAYGGVQVATPTCQILPPHMPGFRRYCPYTRDASASGRYAGPDVSRARRLVAASGTQGMPVTVWTTPTPETAVAEARVAVKALRRIGYDARLRTLRTTTFFTYTNDSRNHAQVIDGGWGADYPSPDDFIGKLTCDYFVPGDPLATTDASDFCDPGFDRRVRRAAALQSSDPTAASALWARLDRRLTDLAIWLPTVTPDETDIVSSRVGNYQYNPVWGPLVDQMWIR